MKIAITTPATWGQGIPGRSSAAGSPLVMATRAMMVMMKNAVMARKGMVMKPSQLIHAVVQGIPA